MRVSDKGSESPCARVQVQGVPVYGLIDTRGANITIIGGDLFRRVATIARLRKWEFKKADKTPRTYDQKSFTLDSRMDLDLAFGDLTMRTPVYINMDAPDQLLLSEGVCRQLGIITYHPDIQKWRGGRKKQPPSAAVEKAKVPMVRVKFVQSIQLSPHQSAVMQVQVDTCGNDDPVHIEHDPYFEYETGLRVDDVLLQPSGEGRAQIVVANPTAFTKLADRGTTLGEVIPAAVVEECPTAQSDSSDQQLPDRFRPEEFEEVRRVDISEDLARRQQMLREKLIQVHQTRVTPCPEHMPAGYYWYGRKKRSPDRPPAWLTAFTDVPTAEEARDEIVETDDTTTDESSAQVQPDSLPSNLSQDDSNQEEPATDHESSPQAESESSRAQSRYALRNRVRPPARLMHLSSG